MNQKLKIAGVFFLILMVSSCTNRRYSHLTGFQFKSGKQTKRAVAADNKQSRSDEVVEVFKPEEIKQTIASEEVRLSEEQLINHTYSTKVIQNMDLMDEKIAKNPNTKIPVTTKLLLSPAKKAKKIAKRVKQLKSENIAADGSGKSDVSNLVYWILVVVLVLLIITLLKEILGALYFPIMLIVLIALIGHLLGLW